MDLREGDRLSPSPALSSASGISMKQTNKNPAKVKRAASHPDRPGERCEASPGTFSPRVNRARCEGKADCIEVCPYDVFALGVISSEDFAQLSLGAKLKSLVHGRKTALTPNSDACRACGLCVVACPEHAIMLVPRAAAP